MGPYQDPTPLDDDETRAAELSLAFVGDPDESFAYLLWLRAVARNLVVNCLRYIATLAAALLDRTVLDGEAALNAALRREPRPAVSEPIRHPARRCRSD